MRVRNTSLSVVFPSRAFITPSSNMVVIPSSIAISLSIFEDFRVSIASRTAGETTRTSYIPKRPEKPLPSQASHPLPR